MTLIETDFHSELAEGVQPESLRLHIAALEILEKKGRLVGHTSQEYCDAVEEAQRKTGIPNVHTAMKRSGGIV